MAGRPETHPIKKVIAFDDDMVEAVEKWRKKQKPPLNFNAAVRRLIERGLQK